MGIIDPKDLDPINAGGQIISPEMLDPVQSVGSGNPLFPSEDVTSASLNMFPQGSLPAAAEEVGKGFIEQMPVAGMMIGGAAGLPFGGPAGAAAGAGLGAGIGAAGRGLLQESLGLRPPQLPMQNWQDIGKQAALGTTAEALGPYVAKGIQKVISPFAALFKSRMAAEPGAKVAQQLVEQEGAAISPSEIMDTRTSRFFNWLAEKMWPANAIMANRRQGLQTVADELKNEFVNARGLYNTSRGGVNQSWENWVEAAGGAEAPYELPKTLNILEDVMKKPFAMTTIKQADGTVIEQPIGAFWKKYASTLRQTLNETGQATVQDIRDIFNVLNPMAAKGAERTARMKLGEAIIEDLSASGNTEMVEALQGAREMARLQRIAAPLQRLFDKATILPTKLGEEAAFNPASFINLWNRERGNFLINKNYSAEDIRIIDAFADKMRVMVPDLARAAKFTPSTSLQGITQLNFENPLAVTGMIYKYPGLAVPIGMDALLANSLMSPTGVMRRFLTSGFGPPTLSTKMGLMKGMEAMTND